MLPSKGPLALIILDGFGLAEPGPGNAVQLAHTPNFDRYWSEHPRTTLSASGTDVGLPEGQIGNSEVGHLNIGLGRVVVQSLTHVDNLIASGEFFSNQVLKDALNTGPDGTVHLIGLVSHGGVHSSLEHLLALLELADRERANNVAVHVMTDGRDTAPDSGLLCVLELQAALERLSIPARVASVTGRYWAMDRDRRWDRTKRAYDAIVCGRAARNASSAANAVQDSYKLGTTDEFIEPTIIGEPLVMQPDDQVIFFNFRADRARQLSHALTSGSEWKQFERCSTVRPRLTTFMEYDSALPARHAFALPPLDMPLAQVISRAGLSQYHAAETEKYAHVTYFFNAQREEPFEGEERRLVPSPKVPTYDLQPEMSALELTDAVVTRLQTHDDAFLLVNFANPDMVGHTGVLGAAIRACEATDEGLGRIVEAVTARGGVAVVLADHGNAEQMLAADGASPHTAHTTNPVPFIVIGAGALKLSEGGRLADVAPTVLQLLGIAQPAQMTGRSLLAGR